MTDPVAPHRLSAIRELLPVLTGARRVVLTTHLNADGDGAGCQAALASWLGTRGVEVLIVNPTPFPDSLAFLLDDAGVVLDVTVEDAGARVAEADLCVVVDTGEVPRIGRVHPLVKGLPTAVIDHHPPGDRAIEGISYRDSTAAATGELLYDLFREAGGPWTQAMADGLYVAILTDTGGFRFSNTTPGALRAVAGLVERGASPEGLHKQVYGTAPLRRLRLLAASLPTVQSEDGVAWIVVPREAFEELGATSEDLEGFVDQPRSLEGVEVGLLFRSIGDGGVKISFRSNGPVDVNQVARAFGGGGHVRAAGAVVQGDLLDVQARVVAAVKEAVRGVDSGTSDPGER